MTDLLVEICKSQGWKWFRQQVHPGRDNLLVKFEGSPTPEQGGELLLWDVHQDTVPVDGMIVDPFGGELRDGRVYGRGACDVKGAMAAMLAALSRIDNGDPGTRPSILLACTANEECGFTGAEALSRTWPRVPDAAIVAEPTDLHVVVAHKGVVRWRVHTLGRAAHSSHPEDGINAVYAMARVIQTIERFHDGLSTATGHPLCGPASACVSTVQGGVSINTVPDRATIEIDYRLPPGESPEEARSKLMNSIRQQVDLGNCQLQEDFPFRQGEGLSDRHNRPLAEGLAKIVLDFGRPSELVGVPYGTNAAVIAAAGVPTVVFGPGSIAQAHTADEFIEVSELQLATEIFYRIACSGLR
jgi:acetylornithine deacetylase